MNDTDLDAKLADILARSAALPPLDTTAMTLDEAVTATIRQVVDTSPLRLRGTDGHSTPHFCPDCNLCTCGCGCDDCGRIFCACLDCPCEGSHAIECDHTGIDEPGYGE